MLYLCNTFVFPSAEIQLFFLSLRKSRLFHNGVHLHGVCDQFIIFRVFHQAVRGVAVVVLLKQLWHFMDVLINDRLIFLLLGL